jgi:hypothetical protein
VVRSRTRTDPRSFWRERSASRAYWRSRRPGPVTSVTYDATPVGAAAGSSPVQRRKAGARRSRDDLVAPAGAKRCPNGFESGLAVPDTVVGPTFPRRVARNVRFPRTVDPSRIVSLRAAWISWPMTPWRWGT